MGENEEVEASLSGSWKESEVASAGYLDLGSAIGSSCHHNESDGTLEALPEWKAPWSDQGTTAVWFRDVEKVSNDFSRSVYAEGFPVREDWDVTGNG